MSRLNRGVIAASAERKRWLTDGADATSPNGAANGGALDQDGDVSSILSKSRAEHITKELRCGYSSADILRSRADLAKARSALVDLSGPNFVDRFVNLPDGREVARAAVAIALLKGPDDLKRCSDARIAAKNPSPQRAEIATKFEGAKVLKKRATFQPTPASIKNKNGNNNNGYPATPGTLEAIGSSTPLLKEEPPLIEPTNEGASPSTPKPGNTAAIPGELKGQAEWLDNIVNAFVYPPPLPSASIEIDFTKLVEELRHRKLPESTANLPSALIYPAERLPFLRAAFRRDDTKVFRRMSPKKSFSPKFRSVPRSAILARVQDDKITASVAKTLFPTDSEQKPGEQVGDVAASQLMQQPEGTNGENATKSAAGSEVPFKVQREFVGHWKKLLKALEKDKDKKEDVEATGTPPPKVKMPVYFSPAAGSMARKLQKRRKGPNNRVMSSAISPAKRSTLEPVKPFARMKKKGGIAKNSPASPGRPIRKSRSAKNAYKDFSSDDHSFTAAELSSDAPVNTRPSRKLRPSRSSDTGPSQRSGTTRTSGESPSSARKLLRYKVSKGGTMTSTKLKEILAKVPDSDFPYYLSPSVAAQYASVIKMEQPPDCALDEVSGERVNGLPIVARLCHTKNEKKASAYNILTKEIPHEDVVMLGINGKKFHKSNPLKTDIFGLLENKAEVVDKYIGPDSEITKYVARLADEEKQLSQWNEAEESENEDEDDVDDVDNHSAAAAAATNVQMENVEFPVAPKRRKRPASAMGDKEAEALLQRVCGTLKSFMKPSDLELCAQWARRDFAAFEAFENVDDALEVTLNVKNIQCDRCVGVDRNAGGCEESIVLKLWRNMTWRKVRRLRHVLGSD